MHPGGGFMDGDEHLPEWFSEDLAHYYQDPDDVLREDRVDAYRRLLANDEARTRLHREKQSAEVAQLTGIVSAARLLKQEPEALDWVVKDLHARGDSTMLVAQNKVGKTTLALNLVRSLIDGEPFLGEWDVDLGDGCILYLNYEVSEARFVQWVRRLRLGDPHRLVPLSLRGLSFPPDHPDVHRQVARIAEEHESSMIIVDPFQRAFTGESENNSTEVGKFLSKLDEMKEAAGVADLILIDHAGHGAKNRARGSSTKGGWADSTWTLTNESGLRHFRS